MSLLKVLSELDNRQVSLNMPTLDKLAIKKLVERNPDYSVCFETNPDGKLKNDCTKWFIEWVDSKKNSLKHEDHGKIEIAAKGGDPSGGGKSYIGATIAGEFSDDPLPLENVYFSKEDCINDHTRIYEIVKEHDVNQSVLVDELEPDYGVGLIQRSARWVKFLEQVRKSRVSIVLASNTFQFSLLCHYLIQTLPSNICFNLNITRAVLLTNWQGVLGAIVIPSPRLTLGEKWVKDYEEKKDAYQKTVFGLEDNHIEKLANIVLESDEFRILADSQVYKDGIRKPKTAISEKLLIMCINEILSKKGIRLSIQTEKVADMIRYMFYTRKEFKEDIGGFVNGN